jgi:CheY-like chemotaxis protein/DNA-binding CsgD family transcriptional regulator
MEQYSILIVDDEPAFITNIIDILEKEPFNFIFYSGIDGAAGIEIAKKRIPNLILTDWNMPKINGIEFLKLLKQNPNTKDIPVIMVTGSMLIPHNLKQAFDENAVDFIRKPIEPIELVSRVKSAIKIFEYKKLELEYKNKELATYAVYTAEMNNYLQSLLKELNNINVSGKSAELNNIIHNIKFKLNHSNFNSLDKYFKQLLPSFEKKLLLINPSLSATDIKLAYLIRTNISTKEIADIMCYSPDSIKTARYRLRKKLNLLSKENMYTFLSKL